MFALAQYFSHFKEHSPCFQKNLEMTVGIHLLSQNHLNWAIPRVLLQLLYISIWSIWHHMEKILFALQLLASQTPWICIIQCFKLRFNLEPEHGGRHGLPKCSWSTVGSPGQGCPRAGWHHHHPREAASSAPFLHLFPQENDHPQMSNAPEINLTDPRAK